MVEMRMLAVVPGTELNRYVLLRTRDFKLRRLRGVRAARRNPERSRGISVSQPWCPGPELNRYVLLRTRDFKSRASASFATRARHRNVLRQTISVRQPAQPRPSLRR